MSVCNYVDQIIPSTCIGDSLLTINSNFSALDTGLCEVPNTLAGPGTKIQADITEQYRSTNTVLATNSFAYKTEFDSLLEASEQTYTLMDGTEIKTTVFPYKDSTSGSRPIATFSTVAPANSVPKVSLYWLAQGIKAYTVYATNSSVSTTDKGPIWLNGPVNALYRVNNTLYVGGEFTTCGGSDCRKLGVISLDAGASHPTLSTVGALQSVPFTDAYGDLGLIGSVNAITTTTTTVGSNNNNFLIAGGSYKSASKGKGLSILNTTTSITYPFYINGSVHTLFVVGNSLLVGGDFDYINYGPNSASTISGLRRYTKGLFKIDLDVLTSVPEQSINQIFINNINSLFYGPTAVVNAIVAYNSILYVGGKFQSKLGENLNSQNLILMNSTGVQNSIWKPVINGPVHSLVIDDTTGDGGGVFLYAGGDFNKVYTTAEFYSSPREVGEDISYYGAFSAQITTTVITIKTNWKPKFSGPVTSLALHDNDPDTYVYCYGSFIDVNDESCGYTAAITKASTISTTSGSINYWNVNLQTAPNIVNSAINRCGNSIIFGGNFTKVNSDLRYYLARVNGVDESLTSPALSAVTWDFNAQVVNQGMPFNFTDLNTQTYRVTSVPNPSNLVNCTTFTLNQEGFRNLNQGQLCRFFVRRPGNAGALGTLPVTNDTFQKTVNVIGWKVDFNS